MKLDEDINISADDYPPLPLSEEDEDFMDEYCTPCTERVGHTRPQCDTPLEACVEAMKEERDG